MHGWVQGYMGAMVGPRVHGWVQGSKGGSRGPRVGPWVQGGVHGCKGGYMGASSLSKQRFSRAKSSIWAEQCFFWARSSIWKDYSAVFLAELSFSLQNQYILQRHLCRCDLVSCVNGVVVMCRRCGARVWGSRPGSIVISFLTQDRPSAPV